MSSICRVCVHVIASEAGGYTYTKDICPERGLSAQAYRCAECNTKITFSKSQCLNRNRLSSLKILKLNKSKKIFHSF